LDRQYGPNDVAFAEEIAAMAALAIDNARLFAQAQRAIGARDAVLGIVAHDLRNPLNNIMMSAVLLNAKAPADADQTRQFADQAMKAAKQMNRMIQDLLDIASMETGHLGLDRKPVPASALVAEVLEANRSQAGGRELRSEVSLQLPNVDADSDRILQVFSNLVGNAIKFTPQSARIAIGGIPDGSVVRFWVSDNGPGISTEHLPHVFSRFWQSAKADRRGLGLGLSICKSIVEAHCGRIWVTSEPNRGTTFFFSLPISVPAASEVRAECWDSDVERPFRRGASAK
jgi:signal transduction histidine kinase